MNGRTAAYIHERFRKAVTLHIVRNILQLPNVSPPLMLGVHGPSGDGKTFQCERVLEGLGVTPFIISGGELESGEAGKPAELIREKYLEAGKAVCEGKVLAATLLINDFDTGVGNWGEMVQYTTNRQIVFVELMNLADYPECVEGKQTIKIPIILTGNNFTSLYEPLTRSGRMQTFEWKPTLEEKYQVVKSIYPSLSPEDVHTLVSRYPDQPLAFFAFLKTVLLDDDLWKRITDIGEMDIIHRIREQQGVEPFDMGYNIDSLLSTADRVYKEGLLVNHLSSAGNTSKEELSADRYGYV